MLFEFYLNTSFVFGINIDMIFKLIIYNYYFSLCIFICSY